MNGLTEQEIQAIVVRALKTFLQAFLAALLAGVTNITNIGTAKALAISAIAAGISAIFNAFIKPVEAK